MEIKTFKQFLIEAPLGIAYHGTPYEKAAQQILKDGVLKPNLRKNGGNLQPMEGQTYFTTNLSYALIHGLGANMVGHKINDNIITGGEYGYIFVVDNSKMKNHIPDEDIVGEIARDIIDDEDSYNFTEDEIEDVIDLIHKSFNNYMEEDYERELEESPYERFINHEYEFFAYVGKFILNKASKRLIIRFRQNADQYSHSGDTPIKEAYKFKKKDSEFLEKDGSNFKQYATKIR